MIRAAAHRPLGGRSRALHGPRRPCTGTVRERRCSWPGPGSLEAERIHGAGSLEAGAALEQLAEALLDRPQEGLAEGTAYARRALEIREAHLGPEHPDDGGSAGAARHVAVARGRVRGRAGDGGARPRPPRARRAAGGGLHRPEPAFPRRQLPCGGGLRTRAAAPRPHRPPGHACARPGNRGHGGPPARPGRHSRIWSGSSPRRDPRHPGRGHPGEDSTRDRPSAGAEPEPPRAPARGDRRVLPRRGVAGAGADDLEGIR